MTKLNFSVSGCLGNLSPSRSVCAMRGAASVALPRCCPPRTTQAAIPRVAGAWSICGLPVLAYGVFGLGFRRGGSGLALLSCMVSVACQVFLAFPGCPVLVPVVMSGHRWLGRLPHFGANPAIWFVVVGLWLYSPASQEAHFN